MANWVNGHIIPKGTPEQIKVFTEYTTSKEEWKKVINRNCPPEMEENEIHIYDNDAWHAISIAEEMEEKFRDIDFEFCVVDEMNAIGWKLIYENGIETGYVLDEDESHEYLVPKESFKNEVTDEFIVERNKKRQERDNKC